MSSVVRSENDVEVVGNAAARWLLGRRSDDRWSRVVVWKSVVVQNVPQLQKSFSFLLPFISKKTKDPSGDPYYLNAALKGIVELEKAYKTYQRHHIFVKSKVDNNLA